MKSTLALLALVGSATAGMLTPEYVEANHGALWASFKETHARNYTSASEEAARKGIFKMNMMKAAAAQSRNPLASFGATPFADMTEEEFRPFVRGMAHHLPELNVATEPLFTAEQMKAQDSNVDWRSKGAVTAVKNQAACGSCWAFSTTGVTEGANFLHGNGKLTSLSEQEFVSCDKQMYGCSGGLPLYAYQWAVSANHGEVVTEDAYPYTSQSGSVASCKKVKKMEVGATIKSSVTIDSNEEQMAAWLKQNGPISIGVNAADDWQLYGGGVLTGCAATQPDHAVLIVGVTSEYWIVKNSWGTTWGESGYIRLAFGSNQCNIKFSPTAPKM